MLPLLLLPTLSAVLGKYEPTWESLESRSLPTWYDEAKFGIFCHWGVYSVPAFKNEWFWWYWKDQKDPAVLKYVEKNFEPGTSYADFAHDFGAELFDPQEFVNVVKSSGAKYFVFTSKHVEGFTMWPSKYSWNWNSGDVGPKRDVVGELQVSFQKAGLHFGLYYSLYEWFHPLFLKDRDNHTSQEYIEEVVYPQMLEIVRQYKPDIFWSDGDFMMDDNYWRSKEFIAWLYNESPVKDSIVVNDRWGKDDMGRHGGFLTFQDKYDPGYLIPKKWESCYTMDAQSWGYRRNILLTDVATIHELISQLARTISCGGNFLLNVGPDKHGRIPLIFQERLAELGKFVNATSEAIFASRPWTYQNDTGNIWYTSRNRNISGGTSDETIIYAWILTVTGDNIPIPRVKITKNTIVTFLGTDISYKPKGISDIFIVPESKIPWSKLPRKDVIVIKIEYAGSFGVSERE